MTSHSIEVNCGQTESCRVARVNFSDFLLVVAYFQIDLLAGDALLQYLNSGGMQVARNRQDNYSAVALRRLNKGINAQSMSDYGTTPEFRFRSDIFMAYHSDDIVSATDVRDLALNDLRNAEDGATKMVRLQNRLYPSPFALHLLEVSH